MAGMKARTIMITAARLAGVTPQQLIASKAQCQRLSWPRFAAMAVCRRGGISLNVTGRAFHRNFNSVVNAEQRAAYLARHSSAFSTFYHDLQQISGAAMHLYLIGPWADNPAKNAAAYNAAANRLNQLCGYGAINPVTVDLAQNWGKDFQHTSDGGRRAIRLKAAIRNVLASDGVLLLDGWQECDTAALLHDIAGLCRLPVYASFADIPATDGAGAPARGAA